MKPLSATYADRDAYRRDLKAEETRLCHALQSVRARINGLVTVNTLPPEIILQIFADIAYDHYPIVHHDRRIPTNLGWIRTLTHVCQHWRHIALANPSLWTNICTSLGPRWAQETFKRSRTVPVSLLWTFTRHISTSLDKYLYAQLSQPTVFANVRTLNLTGEASILRLLEHPAPALEKFTLHYRFGLVDLSAHIFSESAPKLQTLRLFHCSIPWGSPILNNLTHLTVVYPSCEIDMSEVPVYDDKEKHPTHEQLLEFLRNATSLETLSLSHALPIVDLDTSPANDSPIVTLPHLKTLILTGRVGDCSAFLRSISFPHTTNLTLNCIADVGSPPGQRLLDIIPVLVARVEDSAYDDLPIQEFRILDVDCFTISVFIDAPSYTPNFPGTTPRFGTSNKRVNVFTATFSYVDEHLPYLASIDIIQSLCRALPLYNRVIELLYFVFQSDCLAKLHWLNIFFPFRHIRRMEYSGLTLRYSPTDATTPPSSSPLPLCFNVLMDPDQFPLQRRSLHETWSDPESGGSSKRLIFPGLRSLKFRNVNFGPGANAELRVQGFLRDLVWQMEERKKEGDMLEELVIEELVVERSLRVSTMEQCRADIERLREVVKVFKFE